MILKFNDATELQIQSAEPVGQGLRVLVIGTTPEQLRILFSDKVKTKVMKVEERGDLLQLMRTTQSMTIPKSIPARFTELR